MPEMHMKELMEMRIWFCWRYEMRKGNKTKVPKSIYGTATGTTANYAHSWVPYDEAAAAEGFDGIGFVIPEGYFFLDLDHKDLSDSYVKLLLERFDSYAERR